MTSVNWSAWDHDVTRCLRAIRGATDSRERERAVSWLLAHADRTYPVVLAQAEAAPADAWLVELLGRFRRCESTPVLLRAFQLGEPARRYAAGALGTTPDAAAQRALLGALEGTDAGSVIAALAGIEASGDARLGANVRELVRAADAQIRWMALHACGRLGCISRGELADLAHADDNALVRNLALALCSNLGDDSRP